MSPRLTLELPLWAQRSRRDFRRDGQDPTQSRQPPCQIGLPFAVVQSPNSEG